MSRWRRGSSAPFGVIRPTWYSCTRASASPPKSIARLRTLSPARWANWFPDDPHLLELSLKLAPAYDAFFTHDSYSAALHRERGYPTHYLPFGVDTVRLQPVAVPPQNRSALAFVGTRDVPRAHLLDSITDLGLSAWGPGWPRGPLYGSAFIRTLCGADIGLNVHQQVPPLGDPARYGHGANLRVFELAALGTPQLCDAKADISSLFEPDREIVLYHDVAELRAQVERMRRDHRVACIARQGSSTARMGRAHLGSSSPDAPARCAHMSPPC